MLCRGSLNPDAEQDWWFVRVEVPDDFEEDNENEVSHLLTAIRHARDNGGEPVNAVVAEPGIDGIGSIMTLGADWGSTSIIPLVPEDLLFSTETAELLGEIALNAFCAYAHTEGLTRIELLKNLRHCLNRLEEKLDGENTA